MEKNGFEDVALTFRDPRDGGFNYSRGWGSEPKPPVYLRAMNLARRLGREATEKSKEAWAMEHACWRVRIATTGADKAAAVRELAELMRNYPEK